MLVAPGTWPPRWAVSLIPGGAMTLPVNSSGLRTSTRGACFSLAASTSGTFARSEPSTEGTLYWLRANFGTSVVSGAFSSLSHLARPPFSSRTSLWP